MPMKAVRDELKEKRKRLIKLKSVEVTQHDIAKITPETFHTVSKDETQVDTN